MADQEKPIDAGHLYRPSYWPKGHGEWKPHAGICRHAVHDEGRSVGFHQCSKKASITRTVTTRAGVVEDVEYCGVHDPVKVKAKREARDAKWRAEWAARDAARDAAERMRKAREECAAAIVQIAAGHNDARGLAMDIMAKWPELAPVEDEETLL